MNFSYKPSGVCSQKIDLTLEDGVITSVQFTGGCNGNLQGIAALVQGQPAQEVLARLEGIHCGMKHTSCPDQLSRAIRQALAQA